MAGVELRDKIRLAAAGQHPDVVAGAPQLGGLSRHGQLDPPRDGGGWVVQDRQTRSRPAAQAGSSSCVMPGGTRSTFTWTPSPHSMVKSSSPSPTRMPSTL